MRVDSHQHFWKLERGDYGWLTSDLGTLYRDYLPSDLLPHLKENHIDRTIVVQAAPTVAETEFLLSLAESHDFIAGVVGWIEMDSPTFVTEWKRLRKHKKFVGIRPMLQDLEDDRWILRAQVLENIKRLLEEDFPLDILVKPRHLPHVIELLERFPTLKAVIDHAAKPQIAAGVLEPWREQLRVVASFPHVMCKLSGMITEANHGNWRHEDLFPYVHHVMECFGNERILFGSDWPVCLLAGTYSQAVEALLASLPHDIAQKDVDNLFGGNAIRFYQLDQLGGHSQHAAI